MRRVGAIVAVVSALLLTGCAATGIAEWQREQTAADRIDLPERYLDAPGFERDSIRWLAEDGGVDFYAARITDGACVILVNDGDVDGALSGCGGGEVRVSGLGFPHARLYVDVPAAAPDHLKQLTPNLYVSE